MRTRMRYCSVLIKKKSNASVHRKKSTHTKILFLPPQPPSSSSSLCPRSNLISLTNYYTRMCFFCVLKTFLNELSNSLAAMHKHFYPNSHLHQAVETCARIASFASAYKMSSQLFCAHSRLSFIAYFLHRALLTSVSAQDTQSCNQSTWLFYSSQQRNEKKKLQHSISCTSDFLEQRKNSF